MATVDPRRRRRGGLNLFLALALVVGAVAGALILLVWRDDILEAFLDPEIPYAVYKPPPAPDYRLPSAWALIPGALHPGDPPVDVFFIHPTTFDGGRDWNGPIGDRRALKMLRDVMLPNYAGPFGEVGRVFAPLYRQASLYTSLTLFDDAIEARQFAYLDVRSAFTRFLERMGPDRPFILAGVEQGGGLAARLLRNVIAPDAVLRNRLAAAYLIETVAPADEFGPESAVPACRNAEEPGCVVAWVSTRRLDFIRADRIAKRGRVWNDEGRLVDLGGRTILCVNPLLGRIGDDTASDRLNQGAANATDIEWGVRPGLMARQVGAACRRGILRVDQARSSLLRPSGSWADRLRVAPFNLFWADIRDDARRRSAAWAKRASHPASLEPPSTGQSKSALRL